MHAIQHPEGLDGTAGCEQNLLPTGMFRDEICDIVYSIFKRHPDTSLPTEFSVQITIYPMLIISVFQEKSQSGFFSAITL